MAKIQEINFAKAHLTELLVEKENQVHNLEIEKESYEKHCTEIQEERDMLRDYIEKLNQDYKDFGTEMHSENKNLTDRIKELEKIIDNNKDLNKKLSIELESLKDLNRNLNEKNKTLEADIKDKINEMIELEAIEKETRKKLTASEEKIIELTAFNEKLNQNVTDLNKQIHTIEKENIELLKKNKNLIISQENFQADLMKQNGHLLSCENKLKEQIQKNLTEIEKLKDERESLKKMMNEAISNCSVLIKEKADFEKELNQKNIQIENLKNANVLLHKNFSSVIDSGEFKNEDKKLIKIGEMKIEENNMSNLKNKLSRFYPFMRNK